MTAFRALNNRQFFHGTTAHFEVGDVIDPKDRPVPTPLPESERIGPWTHRTAAGHLMADKEVNNPPNLYITPKRSLAQHYADQHKETGGNNVYRVRLSGEHRPDPYPAKGHFFTEHPVQVMEKL